MSAARDRRGAANGASEDDLSSPSSRPGLLPRGRARRLAPGGAARGARPGHAERDPVVATAAGFDTHLFRPAMDSKGLFTVNGSDILGANDISFGLVIDYGARPARARRYGGAAAHRPLVPGDAPVQLRPPQPVRRRPRRARRPDVGRQQLDRTATAAVYAGPVGARRSSTFQGLGFLARPREVAHHAGSSTASASRSACRSGGGLERRGRRTPAADHGFWYWPQVIVEKRFGSNGPVSHRAQRAATAGTRRAATVARRSRRRQRTPTASLFTYGGGVSCRVLEPLDLVAETYGTYLLASDADSGVKRRATRPSAASSSSSSATRT